MDRLRLALSDLDIAKTFPPLSAVSSPTGLADSVTLEDGYLWNRRRRLLIHLSQQMALCQTEAVYPLDLGAETAPDTDDPFAAIPDGPSHVRSRRTRSGRRRCELVPRRRLFSALGKSCRTNY
jgi:hypothetical protein